MRNSMALCAPIVALSLVACGGGGGGDATGSGVSAASNNPLKKYEGTYYFCDGNTKETFTLAAVGENSLSIRSVEETYQNANCTGAVVGTYRLPQNLTVTYTNKTTANFPPVTILPSADAVDGVTITSPAMVAQLTGSGVSGSCVYYTGGNVCYDSLALPAASAAGAIYLSGNYVVTLILNNGTLEADAVYSKEASFNMNMLIAD